MRILNFNFRALLIVCGVLVGVITSSATDFSEIERLLDQTEQLLLVGVADKGGSRSFEDAIDLAEVAAERLDEADLSPAETRSLSLELKALQEDLDIFTELYADRFYGVFLLVRLINSALREDEGLALTEQMSQPPDVAAVVRATRKFLNQIDGYHHPHIIITSQPTSHRLENVAFEVLVRDGRSTPHTRRALVSVLSEADMDALDRGDISPQLVERIKSAFDNVDLIALTIGQRAAIDGLSFKTMQGDHYTYRNNALSETFEFFGVAQDRRDQARSIGLASLLLLVLAISWSAFVPWDTRKPMKVIYRVAIGVALFVFGRIFIMIAVMFMRKITPDPYAMIAVSWWWPALIGLLTILAGGLAAWIGIAILTNKIPGASGARAVASIFVLVTIGACSYFVTPLLLLDGSRGFANLTPFVLASVGLATVFGMAIRTGPPVPHYFAIGPLLLAPLAGICVLIASPSLLWAMVGLTGILYLIALVRHRVKLAHGTEEPEPSAEEAAQKDQQTLVELSKKLAKKL